MPKKEKYKKKQIPQALREQVWVQCCGQTFLHKCLTTWCKNQITVFDFHCGHNIPESKGGKTTVNNLVAICNRCNLSMGSQYTFQEWCASFEERVVETVEKRWIKLWCC
jgi:5-methylcytosine-specific restriction endonuclease McrA